MKLKKGDEIIVTLGKYKGKKGKVEKAFPKVGKIIVAGINIVKRHRKKRDDQHPAGIAEIVKPMDVSKVSFVCPKCGKQARIGYRIVKGEKERFCKKCEQII